MKRATPIAGFVSTAVLTSEDGLFGKNAQETRIADDPAPKEITSSADYKPLYERLQEQKQQKEDEWKEKNNPFAPPKALDDEEIEFIRDLESKQRESQQKQKAQTETDLAEFLSARENSKQTEAAPSVIPSQDKLRKLFKQGEPKKSATVTPTPVCVVRKKRKQQTDAEAPVKPQAPKRQKQDEQDQIQSQVTVKKPNEPSSSAASAPGLGLVAYSSDSSSDAE